MKYSFTESDTNKTWVDNKPIYSIVIPYVGSESGKYYFDVGNLLIDSIININALGHDDNDPDIVWCWNGVGESYNRTINYDGVSHTICVTSYQGYFPVDYLIIEYTKQVN